MQVITLSITLLSALVGVATAVGEGCSTMPPGNCNAVITSIRTGTSNGPTGFRYQASIYDYNCAQIGRSDDLNVGAGIDSTLPWVAVFPTLDFHDSTWYNFEMKYADQDLVDGWACGDDFSSTIYCAHAFKC